MRTNIELDDDLVKEGMRLSGAHTKKELVNLALKRLIEAERRKGILDYFGTGLWEGDLGDVRGDRPG